MPIHGEHPGVVVQVSARCCQHAVCELPCHLACVPVIHFQQDRGKVDPNGIPFEDAIGDEHQPVARLGLGDSNYPCLAMCGWGGMGDDLSDRAGREPSGASADLLRLRKPSERNPVETVHVLVSLGHALDEWQDTGSRLREQVRGCGELVSDAGHIAGALPERTPQLARGRPRPDR